MYRGSILAGLDYLRSAQQPDGSFESIFSLSPSMSTQDFRSVTTFLPSIMLSALSSVAVPESQTIRLQVCKWLLSQKSRQWSFNYWSKSSPEYSAMPYPDDLDDTFCALIALKQTDEAVIGGDCLGSIVNLLIAAESEVGGPYKTWLVPKDAKPVWQDIDLAVNSNIACFLSLVAEPLTRLCQMMDKAVDQGKYESVYYPSAYPIIYYIARAYRPRNLGLVVKYLQARSRNGKWQNPLNTACAVSTLTRLGRQDLCRDAVDYLKGSQNNDGSWPANAFWLDPGINRKRHYGGSKALTTALVIESLSLYENHAKATNTRSSVSVSDKIHAKIVKTAQKDQSYLSSSLKRHTARNLDHMLNLTVCREITLLPYSFAQSLNKDYLVTKRNMFVKLGLANLYGWTAYTIYDNFLDNEGRAEDLSVANICQRNCVRYFELSLPGNNSFRVMIENLLTKVDEANSWEVDNCRFQTTNNSVAVSDLPDYGSSLRLAERSIGHTLGPLGVLASVGVDLQGRSATILGSSLVHYLTARQLSDDMHDWEKDLRAGLASYVVIKIMKDMNLKPGLYLKDKLVKDMRNCFWHSSVNDLCRLMKHHTTRARSFAEQSGFLCKGNIVDQLTERLDQAAEKTIIERDKAKQFLQNYMP